MEMFVFFVCFEGRINNKVVKYTYLCKVEFRIQVFHELESIL